ncbi:Putative Function: in S. cerevisiae FLR1 confers resistance to cerulenin [Aspergillus calidoustus]|uniref:Putative Function: in S. cerevisiae FLR1 confers resistance to cerulenin n=1 Tax=Aspergillus calidoustus TaxID=454130 RepID=A0A0U5GFW9_ASPCI|nr:Putative Function: in S. cerevisiae FLR1 confers resistance to cerulenin [Aspergillus calidoustus]
MILVFQGVFAFLVVAYPLYAASALGANSLMRSIFAAAFPLFGVANGRSMGYIAPGVFEFGHGAVSVSLSGSYLCGFLWMTGLLFDDG